MPRRTDIGEKLARMTIAELVSLSPLYPQIKIAGARNRSHAQRVARKCKRFLLDGGDPETLVGDVWFENDKWRNRDLDVQPSQSVDTVFERNEKATGDTKDFSLVTSKPVKTLEQLYDVCEVDEEEWECVEWSSRAWNQGQKGPDGGPIVLQLFSVSAKFKRRTVKIELQRIADAIISDIKDAVPSFRLSNYEPGDCMLSIEIPDLHLGKGAPLSRYSYDDVERIFLTAIHELIERSSGFEIDQIVFPVGNDGLHTDSSFNTTTSGTHLNYIGEWADNYRKYWKLVRYAVESILIDVAPVHMIFVPGNHDQDSVFTLGEMFDALYESHPNITVDNSMGLRKYYKYGKNLIGYTHGKPSPKLPDLPMAMATDVPHWWSTCPYREYHTGHLHHKKKLRIGETEEHMGTVVRVSSALCPADRWHDAIGFGASLRGAEAFVYGHDTGLQAHFHYIVSKDDEEKIAI